MPLALSLHYYIKCSLQICKAVVGSLVLQVGKWEFEDLKQLTRGHPQRGLTQSLSYRLPDCQPWGGPGSLPGAGSL